ncbi:glycosyltransferase family 2 protein [Candidatus Laterigemmans baculatus]|uniref:glycosyltransferase family 2 protein n=1 Tax=Candidatus Laterigemmans baculatus TaxID=2770505 RepID=UPI0013DACF5F|nr:glycosyltransferase family A protein [Candidatus Laterigemmans baculatus]
MSDPKCSICILAYGRPEHLRRTLESIRSQSPGCTYEIIVTDDGSDPPLLPICREFGVERYTYLRSARWRGMSVAANVAYKQARGDVLILQQADVLHASPDAIERLAAVEQGTATIADVWDYDPATGKRLSLYTGKARPRGLFFLGSVHRQAVYAIGGMDEDFHEAGYDDVWFYRCLLENGIQFRYPGNIVGYHQCHNRPKRIYGIPGGKRRMKKLLQRKVAAAEAGEITWRSPGGPWSLP